MVILLIVGLAILAPRKVIVPVWINAEVTRGFGLDGLI
jgi:hypothetical protein